MNHKKLAFLISFSLLIPTKVLAGGGLIYTEVENKSYVPYPGEQYVVRPYVNSDNSGTLCKQCSIKIKLENPQSDDYISQSSQQTDDQGTMYAKVISHITGNRILYSEVTMPDGSIYTSSQVVLNYQNSQTPSIPATIIAPTPTPIPTKPVVTANPKITITPIPKPTIKPKTTLKPSPSIIASASGSLSTAAPRIITLGNQSSPDNSIFDHLKNFFKSIFPFFK